MGFGWITSVEFLDKFLGLDIRGRSPGIISMIIVTPLNKIVNLMANPLQIQDIFNLVDFLPINNLRLGYGVFKDRAMIGQQVGFIEDIIFPFSFSGIGDVELVCGVSNRGGDMEWSKTFGIEFHYGLLGLDHCCSY